MELLTIRDTAQLLKVSTITVRRFIADGRLPAVKVGKGVRIHKEAVDRLVRTVAPKVAESTERVPAGRPLAYDDPMWKLVGSAASESPGDVSENKYRYLAEAYMPRDE